MMSGTSVVRDAEAPPPVPITQVTWSEDSYPPGWVQVEWEFTGNPTQLMTLQFQFKNGEHDWETAYTYADIYISQQVQRTDLFYPPVNGRRVLFTAPGFADVAFEEPA